MNRQRATAVQEPVQEKEQTAVELSLGVMPEIDVLTGRIVVLEQLVVSLAGEIGALQVLHSKDGLQEMTTTQALRGHNDIPAQPTGPVPVDRYGKITDPNWKRDGNDAVNRNMQGKEVQRAKDFFKTA